MDFCAAVLSHICLTFTSQLLVYAIIALAMLIEGEIFLLVAGSLVHFGLLEFCPLAAAAILGTWFSDIFWYWAGKNWGEKFVNRFGRYFFVTPERFERIKRLIESRGPWLIFFSKFSYGLNHFFMVAAGMVNFNFWKFIKYQWPVSSLWAIFFISLGDFFALRLETAHHDIKLIGLGMISLIVLILLIERIFSWGAWRFLGKLNGQNGKND